MASARHDQAEGLRRLLARDYLRIVTVVGAEPSVGKTSAVVNLAASLAGAGKDVLLLDENRGRGNLSDALGVRCEHDLADVLGRRRTLDGTLVRVSDRVSLLPAARGLRQLRELSVVEQNNLEQAFGRLQRPVDVVLVDAVPGADSGMLHLAAHEVVVVLSAGADALKSAYALIKRIHRQSARRDFHVLVNHVTGERQARAIFANIAAVARRYLSVNVHFMGHVPPDDWMRQAARLNRPVVEAFPTAASAGCFRRIALSVTGWPSHTASSGGLPAFIQHLIQTSRASAAGVTPCTQ